MSTENQVAGYGYQEVEVSASSGLKFGLNQGALTLSKFEWINNAGKDGAEMEALDIKFAIIGGEREVFYRKFPITKAFDKNNGNAEVTDPAHPAMIKAFAEQNMTIIHILSCFVDKETLKAAFSKPIANFKEYCKICESILPKDFTTIPLDVFMQWQWNLQEGKDKSFLEMPKNVNQGQFLCKATTNDWNEVRTKKLLKYVDSTNPDLVHPFTRNEWFLNSKFGNQQGAEGSSGTSHETSTGTGSAW